MLAIPYNNLYSQEEINTKADMVKRLKKSAHFVAFRACREKDTSICDSADSPKDCWSYVRSFTFIEDLAEGRCDNINSYYSSFIDVCNALKTGNCSSLSSYKNPFCQGILNSNKNLIVKAFSNPGFPNYIEQKQDHAVDILRIYSGFKYQNEGACNKFNITISNSLVDTATCDMLFGKQSFERKIDDIAKDLMYVLQAKDTGKKVAVKW